MKSDVDSAPNQPHADKSSNAGLFSGVRIVSLCTLLSRILGLVRDVGMATLFGNGAILDAFTVAFRLPNLARRLFGEGALTTAFLPRFVREMEQEGRDAAWRLATAVVVVLTVTLSLVVIAGEICLLALSQMAPLGDETRLLLNLTAALLPYLILICVAAQFGAILNALGHFTRPALLPVLLNTAWIASIWFVAPQFETAREKIFAIAFSIVAAGVLQLLLPLPALRRFGFRFDRQWRLARTRVGEITRILLPVMIGLSVTQLNTLCDSLLAWGLAPPESESSWSLFESRDSYPLTTGTAAALYLGQRMYQFPLGVFGVALGTVLFPLLSRHAKRGEIERLQEDLTLGMRLVIAIGIPASVGLVLLAQPLTTLLFQYGEFDVQDAQQTAKMIAAYGIAVWAYCGLLIIHRGYYAIGDTATPVRIGMMTVGLNVVLNLTLIWPLGGQGLALSTAVCAMIQVCAVTWVFQKHIGRLHWSELRQTLLRVFIATSLMGVVVYWTLRLITTPSDTFGSRLMQVTVPFLTAMLVYLLCAKALRIKEVWLLLPHRNHSRSDTSSHDV